MTRDEEIAELKARLARLEGSVESTPTPSAPTPRPPPRKNNLGWLLAGGLVILVFVGIASSGNKSAAPVPETNATSTDPTAPAPAVQAEATPPVAENWVYDTSSDKITSKETKSACAVSENEVQLSFPYSPSHVRLCVRNSPKYGIDVFASLEGSGQILCRSYEDCRITVRFDATPATHFNATSAADGSTDTIFFRSAPKFIAALRKSKHLVVSLPLYQAGDQEIEWSTSGLQWK